MIRLLPILLMLCSCDSAVEMRNSAPRVTWIAVQPAVDDVSVMTLWIQDQEGDPVDLEIRWSQGASSANIEVAPGGHGLVGLTTRIGQDDGNGQPHEIRWSTSGLQGQEPVELELRATDRQDAGPEVISPSFTLTEGLPEPVAL